MQIVSEVQACDNFLDCTTCKMSKSKIYSVSKEIRKITDKMFQLIHIDLTSSWKATLGRAHFVMVTVDDYSRYGFGYLLKSQRSMRNSSSGLISWRENTGNKFANYRHTEGMNL